MEFGLKKNVASFTINQGKTVKTEGTKIPYGNIIKILENIRNTEIKKNCNII